jgi:hypothetical protein
VSISTYHWNGGIGATPGTISLLTGGGSLGPWQATGSSGQGGATNVAWTVTPGTASQPVIINGQYTCDDSDPGTWSQNSGSGGTGFCKVWVEQAASGATVTLPTPNPPAENCVGSPVLLFNNWNSDAVQSGGSEPTFSTGGQSYCLVSISTYHWNSGQGATPGTIALVTAGRSLGPWQATGSSGQGGAANVAWTVTLGTASQPVIINGQYSCYDSDPGTWSQNAGTLGRGFCKVWVEQAEPSASGPTDYSSGG